MGAWKSFDELEECLTMDELLTAFNKILTRRNEEAEFQAKIAGAEITGGGGGKEEEDPLKKRVRERAERERQEKAKSGEKTEFSRGLGYRVIGG